VRGVGKLYWGKDIRQVVRLRSRECEGVLSDDATPEVVISYRDFGLYIWGVLA